MVVGARPRAASRRYTRAMRYLLLGLLAAACAVHAALYRRAARRLGFLS